MGEYNNTKIIIKKVLLCPWLAIKDFIKHDGVEHAGYISFLLMIGIFPFLFFLVAAISFVSNIYVSEYLGETLISTLTQWIMDSPFSHFIGALKPRIIEIAQSPPGTFMGMAAVSAIWTASSIFDGLRTIFNRAYRVRRPPHYLRRRLTSIIEFFVIIIIISIVVFCVEIVPHLLNGLHRMEHDDSDGIGVMWRIIDVLVGADGLILTITWSFVIGILVYIYYFLPDSKLKFMFVLPGIVTTLFGWWGCSEALMYYITVFPQINLIYGSIAGIIVALLYFYLCSIVLIYGAELNYRISVTKKMDMTINVT